MMKSDCIRFISIFIDLNHYKKAIELKFYQCKLSPNCRILSERKRERMLFMQKKFKKT